MTGDRRDAHDRFVHAATRSHIGNGACPPPPDGEPVWVERAVRAGVLAPVVRSALLVGHDLRPSLRGLRAAATARHMRTLHELAAVRRVLADADVPHAVLKGPLLSAMVYTDRHVRDYTDLDLLVSPRHLRRAVEAIDRLGARLLPADWAHVTRARTAELALQLPHGTVLDLHCSLINRGRTRDGFSLRTDDLLARRVTRTVDGTELDSLDDLDLVLHVLLHACLSGLGQLRWLLDAQQCTEWLDAGPEELATRAHERGLALPARVVLDSVVRHLDPRVEPWARAMGARGTWTATLDALGRRRPPSSPSVTARTTRTWHSATRATTLGSWVGAGDAALLALRHVRTAWPQPQPRPTSITDRGYQQWVSMAEGVA